MNKIEKIKMETNDELYKMKLHEIITFGYVQIMRVPGGWIYDRYTYTHPETNDFVCTSVFVPFNNEFKKI